MYYRYGKVNCLVYFNKWLITVKVKSVIVVTANVGKGPLREYYEEIIKTKNLVKVKICTLWLSLEDYSLLLGKWLSNYTLKQDV